MEGTTSTIASTMSESLTTIANDAVSVIMDVLPIALIVVGAGLVITIGIKLFKRVTGKA